MTETRDRLDAALGDRYRIERMLGEGGMARVWLADDLKHGRQVAIKVLKPELAAIIGAERFLSEIRTTANLQHPHILALYDSGEADGFLFYVMPFIKGESLRDRLDREKQLSVGDALELTRSILSALDYAHRHDVIHRDIKPANILLHDGNALVSDFGIALAVTGASGDRLTETGLSLGTPHYMAPEQATADRDLTARADIYSTACMLYEMLVGAPPHTGPSAQSVLVSILTEDPKPVTQVRRSVPDHVAAALDKALEKLPADRFATAGEFAAALADTAFDYAPSRTRLEAAARATGAAPAAVPAASAGSWWSHPASKVAAAVAVLGFAAAVLANLGGDGAALPEVNDAPTLRVPFALELDEADGAPVLIAPDGSSFAWLDTRDSEEEGHLHGIAIRPADADTKSFLPDTEGVLDFAYSPDGRSIVFAAEGGNRMLAIGLDGGRSVEVPLEDFEREYDEIQDLHWSRDGHVYFADHGGIFRVPENGGTVETVLQGEWHELTQPYPIPGTSWILYAEREDDEYAIRIFDREEKEPRTLVAGHSPRFVAPDLLLYATEDQAAFAIRMNPSTGEVTPPAIPVIDSLAVRGGRARYSISDAGTLVYWAGAFATNEEDGETLAAIGPSGVEQPMGFSSGYYRTPRYSPDGERLVVQVGTDGGISTFDVRRGVRGRVAEGTASNPIWDPEGRRIAYRRVGEGPEGPSVVIVDPDDPSTERVVWTSTTRSHIPFSWTPDGSEIITAAGQGNGPDLYRVPVDGSDPIPFLVRSFNDNAPALSPDGSWLAYESDQSGPTNIYVTSFPDGGRTIQISKAGGIGARWSADGTRLMYRVGDTARVASVRVDAEGVEVLGHEDWFVNDQPGRYISHELHPDGDRILVVRRPTSDLSPPELELTLAFNWLAEVRSRMAQTGGGE